MECKACGAPLARSARGRTPEYCNDRCRKAGQRNRERATQLALALETDVTKSEKVVEPGTLCSTAWDGPAWTIRHESNTSEPGGYDTPGNYWCAACTEHRELMNLGTLLDWPEIFYFPDNSPGCNSRWCCQELRTGKRMSEGADEMPCIRCTIARSMS